jgi:hypothetical protein
MTRREWMERRLEWRRHVAAVATTLCLWVLWGGTSGSGPQGPVRVMVPIDGYDSKTECRAAEKDKVAQDRTAGRAAAYQCLPTGTDPRSTRDGTR